MRKFFTRILGCFLYTNRLSKTFPPQIRPEFTYPNPRYLPLFYHLSFIDFDYGTAFYALKNRFFFLNSYTLLIYKPLY